MIQGQIILWALAAVVVAGALIVLTAAVLGVIETIRKHRAAARDTSVTIFTGGSER